MALKSTVFKVTLQIADMDRHYYQDHQLTIAQHPSETDERMMVRLLAFALNASESLAFSKGLCVDDEAELWDVELNGDINLWVAFGQSDEKWLRKAAGRAKQVILYTYGGRSVPVWWQQNQSSFTRYKNLNVVNIPEDVVKAMAAFVDRTMTLQFTITDGEVLLSNASDSLTIALETLK
ncbi:YaeQ family protein [Shewanella maritima]|uniref:YaeQ family protein n=1 Tax=Shewanella maritima TaxID=2520507 RepID=UPI003737026A